MPAGCSGWATRASGCSPRPSTRSSAASSCTSLPAASLSNCAAREAGHEREGFPHRCRPGRSRTAHLEGLEAPAVCRCGTARRTDRPRDPCAGQAFGSRAQRGKALRPAGNHAERNQLLLIAFASFGVNVARLKGGDPSIFGRSGEETAALRLAGIEFEIVPGVTSALASAAAAQVSLTHRDQAHAVLLISNHLAKSGTLPWRSYVESGATLVIYMPGFDYEQIAGRLQGAGMRAETPCAVVSRVSTPEQQILRTTLNRLPRSSRLPAPTLLVVGEVLRNVEVEAGAGRYAWSTTGPGLSTEISALLASAQTQPLRGDQEHEL